MVLQERSIVLGTQTDAGTIPGIPCRLIEYRRLDFNGITHFLARCIVSFHNVFRVEATLFGRVNAFKLKRRDCLK